MSTTTPPYDLRAFATQLLEEKGFSTQDPDVYEQLKDDLVDRLENRINATLLANMPEAQLEAFSSILDTGTEKEILAFCETHIKDLASIIAAELLTFRTTYVH